MRTIFPSLTPFSKLRPRVRKLFLLLVVGLVLISCNSLKTAVFDQYSYQQTISIKVESLNLMDNATSYYGNFKNEINSLLLDLQKMVEYEKNKPNNEVSYAMWQLITDEDKNLLAGFLKRWNDKSQLSKVFIDEAKIQVTEALDLIIKFEAKKNKENEGSVFSFITNN